jgi:uncharacterized protein (TIGR03083 family)
MTDVIDLIGSEASQLRDFMASLDTAAWSRPSACAGWAVGDVFAHVTQSADTWYENIIRAKAGDPSAPPGQQALRPGERGSETTAQRAIALHQDMGAERLLRAFTDGYERLRGVLLELKSADWDKPCFHRRGVLPVRDYVGIRLQELTIHSWDIRSAFDATADVSEAPLPVLVGQAQRWLTNTFSPMPELATPLRYRFDVSGPATVQQDVGVSRDQFRIEPVAASDADVTFRCQTGNYLLFIYGRLDLDAAVKTGRMVIEGSHDQATRFNTLFRGV